MTLLAAPWIEATLELSLELTRFQVMGLAFLLGSFTVATLSDIKRLSAQREFLEVWVLFTLSVFAYDVVDSWMNDWALVQVVAIKWGLIAILGVLSWNKVGPIFRLARADVFACTAAASLLAPLLIVAFWIALKLFALVLRPVLARGRQYWPFMPVVTAAAVLVLGVSLAFGGTVIATTTSP